tara:strand:+ start:250 stop:894 length:645 start_codon:yes stop_codon:yes gene_type:complete
MQTIPIIISEKILKKIFIEVIDEINKFFKYNYEIIDQYTEVKKAGGAILADLQSIKNISVEELKSKTFFIINGSSHSYEEYSNQISIDRPFKIIDLFLLIEKTLDQSKKRDQKKMNFVQHVFDPMTRTLFKENKSIRLTEKENEIFICLVENNNIYLSKKFLLQKVWKYNQSIDTHTLETHLYSLRKKIDQKLGTKNLITHEEKKGYRINRKLL